jgi:hypothetical protein
VTGLSATLSTASGFGYLATVAVALLLIHLTRYLGPLYFLAAFPATLAHELTHLVLGLVSLGRPSRLRLWPQRRGHGYVMGAVTFDNVRWYNGLIIGLAPLVLLPAALVLLVWRARTAGFGVHEAAWIYAIACLAYASLPSLQDLRIALASSWLALLAAFVAAAWHFGWLARFAH